MTDGTFVSPFPVKDPQALAATEQAQGDLARSVRGLVDACVRTRVGPAQLTDAAAHVDALTARLLAHAQVGPLGVETGTAGCATTATRWPACATPSPRRWPSPVTTKGAWPPPSPSAPRTRGRPGASTAG